MFREGSKTSPYIPPIPPTPPTPTSPPESSAHARMARRATVRLVAVINARKNAPVYRDGWVSEEVLPSPCAETLS